MLLYSAFLLGALGSLHCVGMCGPLMLSASLSGGGGRAGVAVYQSGRLMVYVLLGFVLGGLGWGAQLWNGQATLSVVSGLLLLAFALLRWDPGHYLASRRWYAAFQGRLQRWVGQGLRRGGTMAQFGLGCCNGLVPCGLVYVAAVGAANAGTAVGGGAFMLAFGAGTLPLLMGSLYAGKRMLSLRRLRLQNYTPLVLALSGVLLIWRGWASHLPADFSSFQDVFFPPMCH